jgi:hypothetical protein
MALDAHGLPIGRSDLVALRSRLLSLGGRDLVGGGRLAVEFEPAGVAFLLANGRAFEGASARVIRGEPSRCHENAQLYARLHPAAIWWAGLALSDDGLWRSHSWVMTSHGALIETTERRLRYFGIPAALDPVFADEFSPADRTRIRRRFGRGA